MKTLILIICFLVGVLTAKATKPVLNVLVFTKNVGFHHASIPNAIKSFYEIGRENNWQITFTEDSTLFTNDALSKYQVVVFLLTSGNNLLNENQKISFQKYIEGGGGYISFHSATYPQCKWPWYEKLVGAHFIGHPPMQAGKLIIENKVHPATQCFNTDTLTWTDEFYSFDENPRKNNNFEILVSVDEKSYSVEKYSSQKKINLVMGDHPLVWCQKVGKGRSFQTALGHTPEMYDNPMFRKHIIGAVKWTSGKYDE